MARWLLIVSLGVALVGCGPAPVSRPTQNINAGVNLVPEAVLAAQSLPPDTQPAEETDQPDIVQVVQQSAEGHEMVLRAMRLSGMVPLLQSAGPWTLLAPTDAAFGKLPPGLMDRLLEPGHEVQLRALMQYHILHGRITADQMLQTNGLLKTVNGKTVIVRGVEGKITVNDANVVQSSNQAGNGAIHWIDNVLLPP